MSKQDIARLNRWLESEARVRRRPAPLGARDWGVVLVVCGGAVLAVVWAVALGLGAR